MSKNVIQIEPYIKTKQDSEDISDILWESASESTLVDFKKIPKYQRKICCSICIKTLNRVCIEKHWGLNAEIEYLERKLWGIRKLFVSKAFKDRLKFCKLVKEKIIIKFGSYD